ncbi:unannotated protein [freshwater metagenome]|uniref:Unannotated protein n=1 Tax=freshwater metagenome TaxID=449393 RepID=A0A6J7RZ21_9ZZZZ|nr:hypothetical protein [Actinomycetota bacterium]
MLKRLFAAAVLVAAIFAVLVVSGKVHLDRSSLSISTGSGSASDTSGGKRTANATRSRALGAVPAPITEASGLAASRRNPGVVWTHNDSGGAASLYGLGRRAQLRATLPLSGAANIDWEDIARGPGPSGGPDWLYAADIGDNDAVRSSVRIYRTAEPNLAGFSDGAQLAPSPTSSVELFYPDGARDAEALIVDPKSNDLYLITKRESRSRIYRARAPSFAGESVTLAYVRELGYGDVVGADACPNGRTVLVKRYFALDAYTGSSVANALAGEPSSRLLEAEPQGEAIAADPKCNGYYTLSEGVDQQLIRYRR